MHQIIYASQARRDLPSGEIFRIIEQSARNNPSADITGFLVFSQGHFLQFIEGPLQALETLLATLQTDPRHHSLHVLARRPITERSFPRWRMKRVGDGQDALAELGAMLAEEGRNAQIPDEVVAFVEARREARLKSEAA